MEGCCMAMWMLGVGDRQNPIEQKLADRAMQEALALGHSGVIERQEAAEQQRVVANALLPRVGPWRGQDSRGILEAFGFIVKASDDELFHSVEMPEGWRI